MRAATRTRVLGLAALVATALCAPRHARANGRFPAAQFLAAHGTGPTTRFALRTTFGVIASDDDGASFHWWCEQALLYSGEWDPAVAFTRDGALHVGVEAGITRVSPACAFESPSAAANRPIVDLAAAPDGAALYAIESAGGTQNRVLISRDDGHTYTPGFAFPRGYTLTTVDASPARPARLYVSAKAPDTVERDAHAVFYRSDDGGMTFVDTGVDLAPREVFIGAPDPRDADAVWIRYARAAGTGIAGVVARSIDAGRSFTVVRETDSAVNGFAVAPDGRVWVGSAEGGVERSDDGGRTFNRVFEAHVQCLRYHEGALYICSEWQRDRVALYRWRDGAPAPEAILRFTDVRPSVDCPAGAREGADTCAAAWPSQYRLLVQSLPDAGPEPALDAAVPADAAMREDAAGPGDDVVTGGEPAVTPRCGCSVPGAPARAPRSVYAAMLAVGCAIAWLRAARRARRVRGEVASVR